MVLNLALPEEKFSVVGWCVRWLFLTRDDISHRTQINAG